MVIRTNIPAMYAYRQSRQTNLAMQKNLQRLSSGLRINSAGDDAAGLSLSERMRAKITELGRAGRNVKEGLSLTRIADGALAEINDMLRRAKGLCVEAANGTYGTQELNAISEEINHLFDEVDRITAGTYFNTICLFRRREKEEVIPPEIVPPETTPPEPEPEVYEYIETVEALPKDVFEDWGEIQFIQSKPFDRASGAKQAVAIARLDDSIQTAQDLVGKGIQIGKNRFYLSDGSFYESSSGSINSTSFNFSTLKDQTVSGIMNWFAQKINDTHKDSWNRYTISYNANTRELTLKSGLVNVNEKLMVDGKEDKRTILNGKNAWENGTVAVLNVPVVNGLKEVDGYGEANNQPIYSGTPTVKSDTYGTDLTGKVSDSITAFPILKHALENNSLVVGDDVIELKKISYTGKTWKQYLEAVAAEISKKPDLTAKLDTTEGRIVVTYSGNKTGLKIYENASSAKPTYTTKTIFQCNTKFSGAKIETTQNPSSEHYEVKKITFSDLSNIPFSVNINGSKYLFYDSRATSFPKEDALHRNTGSNGESLIDIAYYGGIMQAFRSCLLNQRSTSGVGTVRIAGENTLEVISQSVNQKMNISITPGAPITVNQVTTVLPPHDTKAYYMFFPQDGGHPFQQTIEIPFHLGETFDKSKLVGSGFTISYSSRYEFVDGAGTGLVNDYHDIDISSCTSFDDLIRVMQSYTIFSGGPGSICRAYLDKSDPYDVQLRFSFENKYYVNVKDGKIGYDGLLQEDEVLYSGGEDVGYSNTAIDFSSITKDNLDTLLGKGFRITCATCAGEYINIFFCWENKGQFPASFQHFDASSGETRTIHNYAVELSKVSDGETIVENIVRTLNPELTHYTTLEVSQDNPSILIARERRQGDVIDVGDAKVRLANLLTGVRVNFTYNYEKKLVTDDPPDVPTEPDDPPFEPEVPPKQEPLVVKNATVKIYTGSNPKAQFIPIHLPYLDLEALGLTLPGPVDLTSKNQSTAELMDRIDQANVSIASARGTIGADYNRLEHAANDLSISNINLTDAESRIRDGDVVELMVERTKLQILTQAQQAMMAQANLMAQNVVLLLQ